MTWKAAEFSNVVRRSALGFHHIYIRNLNSSLDPDMKLKSALLLIVNLPLLSLVAQETDTTALYRSLDGLGVTPEYVDVAKPALAGENTGRAGAASVYLDLEAGYGYRLGEVARISNYANTDKIRDQLHVGGALMFRFRNTYAAAMGFQCFLNRGNGITGYVSKGISISENKVSIYFAGLAVAFCQKKRFDRNGAFTSEFSLGYTGYSEVATYNGTGNRSLSAKSSGIGCGASVGYGFFGPKLRGPYIKAGVFLSKTSSIRVKSGPESYTIKNISENLSNISLNAGMRF